MRKIMDLLRFYSGRSYSWRRDSEPQRCDVVIVTDLCFPGGNASSTLDELRIFCSQGLSVLLVHCPAPRNVRKPISDRYSGHRDGIRCFQQVLAIHARLLIVRHPAMAASRRFRALQDAIDADEAVFVVNNSARRPSGEPVYQVEALVETYETCRSEKKAIYPLGPAIRRELEFASQVPAGCLAAFDWSPTFDSHRFEFAPNPVMRSPFVVGRHARDGAEKWLQSSQELRAAYPRKERFSIRILGGAASAQRVLGALPNNWEVLAFGAVDPADFLRSLDAFVYFPDEGLEEAFGRTIAEAMFSGVPCILPPRFSETFGDLAFYCAPVSVESVVERLAERDRERLAFLQHVRERVELRYGTEALFSRARSLLPGRNQTAGAELHGGARAMPEELLAYKRWVETGASECSKVV